MSWIIHRPLLELEIKDREMDLNDLLSARQLYITYLSKKDMLTQITQYIIQLPEFWNYFHMEVDVVNSLISSWGLLNLDSQDPLIKSLILLMYDKKDRRIRDELLKILPLYVTAHNTFEFPEDSIVNGDEVDLDVF